MPEVGQLRRRDKGKDGSGAPPDRPASVQRAAAEGGAEPEPGEDGPEADGESHRVEGRLLPETGREEHADVGEGPEAAGQKEADQPAAHALWPNSARPPDSDQTSERCRCEDPQVRQIGQVSCRKIRKVHGPRFTDNSVT